MSSMRRAAPDAADVPALVNANTEFAFRLYHVLAKESAGKNLVFSPASISNALAMVDAGARGNTAAEIGGAMHFDALPGERLHAAFNALEQELLARRMSTDKGRTPLELEQADSAWGQRGFPFLQSYLDALARYYGAGLRLADFERDAEAERERINAWVAEQTKGRIKELLPTGILDDLTRLVLVNAVTFSAQWRFPFAKQLTASAPFTRLDGSQVPVPMMHTAETSFDGEQGDDFVAARLSYAGGASMLVIVPDAGRFAEVEQRVGPAFVDFVLARLRPGAQVSIPKLDVRSHASVKDALGALGIHDAFNGSRADFSGIDGRRDLVVSDVVHEAMMHVDEDGTKAAGATAAIVATTSAHLPPVVVNADRPFLYLIRDDATGAILFAGRVLDPTQQS
jgi:serpin B